MSPSQRAAMFLGCALVLGVIAWASPPPNHITDRDVYEATAAERFVPDCTDLHCFRVLVPWVLGALPGESFVKWKLYAVAANAGAVVAVFQLALAFGLTSRAARMAAALSAFGFGTLYTLHDVYTADPLMYAVAPFVLHELLRDRVALAGVIAAVVVLAKEVVVAPLYIFAAAACLQRRWGRAARALVAANSAFLVWLLLQLALIIRFNYGYGDNPSTKLLSGGYLTHWLGQQSPQAALSAMANEFGALYLLAPAGLRFASPALRAVTVAAIPVAGVFAYVQQPDRALWNFHFLATPLAALVLERAPTVLAWATVGTFAFANLRVGAQLPGVPAARFALVVSVILAAAAIVWAWRTRRDQLPQPVHAV